MSKRLFAVIGHPIGHTMSPFIHKRLFEIAGTQGEYGVIDVPPDELSAAMNRLDELAGYNITIPNKQRIIPFLHRLDKRAELYGSVNTVKNSPAVPASEGGSAFSDNIPRSFSVRNCGGTISDRNEIGEAAVERSGFTTDPDGFLKALEHGGIPLAGSVIILGCGGASRTFAFEAALAGCSVTIAARPSGKERQNALADEIKQRTGADIECCTLSEISGEYDLLINGTPVGMYPKTDDMPVSQKALSHCAAVFDAVYNPLETRLTEAAKANGSRAVGGMSMLVWQAASAHTIWDGSHYDPQAMDELISDSAKEQSRLF